MLCMSVNEKRNNSQTFGLSVSLTHGLYPSTLGILNPNVLDMLATYSYIPMPLIRWQPTTPTYLSYLASSDMLLAGHYGELRFYDFSVVDGPMP
jgi:hypothetical protein